MKVVFIGNQIDSVHVIRFSGRKFLFKQWGIEYDVPDELGERLISDFPDRFGKTKKDIEKARGGEIKRLKPVKRLKKVPKPKHPTVKAIKKISKKTSEINKKEGK